MWPLGGSLLLIATGLLAPHRALRSLGAGLDVYLFLAGMMALAEVARREGLFVWLADRAVRAAGGSRVRLFTLVYAVGVGVTAVLSNDATAVVLTPAVAAAVRAAQVDEPLPYLYACAFVANAASFVLPISNPANLVVYASTLPPLAHWFALFALPSCVAVGSTYGLLFFATRSQLRGTVATVAASRLGRGGRFALAAIGATALALIAASAAGAALGAVTFVCAALVVTVLALVAPSPQGGIAALRDLARGVSWGILPLVAGLFVLVGAIETTTTLGALRGAIHALASHGVWQATLATAGVAALASNVTNNLPAGLLAAASVATLHGHEAIRSALMLGIDLGPNLSVTGSLATILWLVALRREGIDVSRGAFLRVGAIAMLPALGLTVAMLAVLSD